MQKNLNSRSVKYNCNQENDYAFEVTNAKQVHLQNFISDINRYSEYSDFGEFFMQGDEVYLNIQNNKFIFILNSIYYMFYENHIFHSSCMFKVIDHRKKTKLSICSNIGSIYQINCESLPGILSIVKNKKSFIRNFLSFLCCTEEKHCLPVNNVDDSDEEYNLIFAI